MNGARSVAQALLVACALGGCAAPSDSDAGALVIGVHGADRISSIVASEAHPVGRGPYEVVESVTDDHITLAANPHFTGPTPAYRRVILRSIPDQNTGVLAIEKGDIAVLADPRPEDVNALEGRPGLTVYAAPVAQASMPLVASSRIAGVVASRDGELHIERWKPGAV